MARNAWVLASLLLIAPASFGANLSSVTVSPTSVVGGLSNPTGTVTLDAAAPSGGVVVTLSSNNVAATVPGSVTVAQGATTATFAVTTTAVPTNATVTLTGTYNAVPKTATLTVTTLVTSVTFAQASVIGGMSATGIVTLYTPAPAGGSVVTLTSSVTTRATVPASITIPAGATIGTFAIPTLLATTTGTTTITTTNAGGSRTAALTTSAVPIADSVALAPSTAFGTSSSTGTINLNGLAPIGGTVVTLTSSNTLAATVPANVTVPAAGSSTTFSIATLTVASNTNVTITATAGGTAKTATLTVAPSIQAFSTTLDRVSVTRGQTPTATVTLNAPAPVGGATVTLTSSSVTNATVPASVVVAAGARTATYAVTTLAGGTAPSVTISSAYGGATKTAVLGLTATSTVLSVAFAPASVAGGQTSTGTVTLSGPAPTGGTVVTLGSSNTSVVTVPASVTVAATASTATFTATTTAVGSNVGTTITATVGGSTASGVLTATAPLPTGVSLLPSTVVGGNDVTGTVTISPAAPTGGVPVFLSSSSTSTATVPISVTVAAGATTATFTVTTFGVASSTPVTISAVKQQTAVTSTMTVNPADVSTVTLNPTSVVAGTTSTGTVTLNGKARTGGVVVALTSSDTTKATVPASVTVPAAATSATFTVTTVGVPTTSAVTISGTYNSITKNGSLTVQAASLSSVSLSASPVVGGNNVTGTVTLNGKAGSSNFVVALTSSDTTVATVPANVTVATNATTATFTVTTLGVAVNKSATITATLAAVPKTVVLSTTPAALASLALSPTSVAGGASSTGTLTLNGNAPPGGAVVTMTRSDPAATVPATVTVAANTKTKTFTVTTTAVAIVKTSTITGTFLGTPQSAPLAINPPALTAVAVNPTSVNGGAAATGTVTISSIAPAGGFAVALTSDNAAATVSPSVTVAAGATTATFSVSTGFVGSITTATITATATAATRTATLTINPVALALSSVSLSPTTLTGGASSAGTVTLAAPAQAGGFLVNLSSDKTAATVPASVTVAQGATTAPFTVSTVAVGTVTTATITATASGVTKTATLTLNPCILSAVSLSPTTVVGGTSSSGTVTLTSAAPAGGFVVSLSSDKLDATAPAGVTVTAGTTSAGFAVATTAVPANVTATITATANGTTKTATLAINAPDLANVTVTPTTVTGGTTATGTVTLTGPSATGGVSVALSSSDPAATVPASVTLLAGVATTTFPIATTNVGGGHSVTVTGTLGATSKYATFSLLPCILGTVPPPASLPSGDVVWADDANPPNSVALGTWNWDFNQHASGANSHTEPATPGEHQHYFETDADHRLYLSATDKIFVYALLSPCDPPREVMLQFQYGGYEFRAYWGEDLIPWGTAGTPSRYYAGPLPPLGQWARLEIPASAVGLAGTSISGMAFTLYDGQAWFDRAGKAITCVPPAASAPVLYPDTVWVDDELPVGATGQKLVWDSSQKASGTRSHTHNPDFGPQDHYFVGTAWDAMLQVGATDKLVVHVLIDPCDPTQEILVRWFDGNWEHGAFWGADLIDQNPHGTGRVYMGALPTPGQWTRLEIPASAVALGGSRVELMQFFTYSGHVWFDRIGKSNASGTAALASLSISPSSVVSGTSITGTVTLTGPSPAGGTPISLSSDKTWAATVPAVVVVPSGASSATFTIATLGIGGTQDANVSATDGSSTFSVHLVVNEASFSSLSISPTSVVAATASTGTVTLNGLAWPDGHVVSVSSNSPYAQVENGGYVVVPGGKSSTTFTISTSAVPSTTTATITGNADSVTRTANLTITPCSFGAAASPSSFPPDTLWFDDALPADANPGGTWIWDTTQKASGTMSHTEPVAVGVTQHLFQTSGSSNLQLVAGDRLVVYVLVDPCHPPREIMIQWHSNDSWEHRVFLGEDLIGWGTLGTESRRYIGSLPVPGQWTRIEVPSENVYLYGQLVDGIAFTLFDGRAWFDHVGKVTEGHTPTLSTFSLSPSTVGGGTSSTGTVTLTGPALAGGFDVSLTSEFPAAASVPSSVTVAPGSPSATFNVTTSPVPGVTPVLLFAHGSGEARSATITVTPPGVASLAVSPSSVVGGGVSVGTVTLTGTAPSGGVVVGLSSANAGVAGVPGTLVVAAGTASATFTVTTSAVSTTQGVLLTATCSGIPQSTTITVNPPDLVSVSLSPPSVTGGLPSTGTVTLTGPAPAGGRVVTLSSSSGSATVQASVTVNASASNATFTVTTSSVGSVVNATITATLGSTVRTAGLTLNPPGVALSGISLSPASVLAGATSVGTVTLTTAALSGGFTVNLSSDNSAATVPASVLVAQGTTTKTFNVTTTSVATPQTPTITATAGIVTITAPLTVNPPPTLSTLSLNPTSLQGGSASTGTVTLGSPALAGGFVVNLSSDNAAATVPATVTVAQGATTATFSVTSSGVSITQTVTITATAGAVTRPATLTVTPPVPALSVLSLNPSSVTGGSPSTGAVTLSNPALTGGFVVNLSSDNSAATVPASVTVAQGATTATFSVTTSAVVTSQTATLTASAGAVTRTAMLVVSRPMSPGELTEGNASEWTSFASDSAATSLTDDATHVRSGAKSLKLVTASGSDTGVRYPGSGQLGWDVSSHPFLTFWAYIESNGAFAGNQPTVVLLGPSGSLRYTPSWPATHPNEWHHYEIALAGDSGWTRTVTGTFDLTNISGFEIHHQASSNGFTAWYDDVSFVNVLPADLAEGNAALWGTTDLYVQRLGNDASHVRSGSSSIDFKTGAGFDAAVVYPAAGNAHWDVSRVDSLTFSIYALNTNTNGFQSGPVVVLKSPNGSFTYTPSGALMSPDAWRVYQIPLAGGGPWSRSSTGAPTLADVNQIEFHFDTWGYGFEVFLDGVTFGRVLADLSLSPASVVGGASATATVTLLDPAPLGGTTLTLASDDSAASTPSMLFVPAGATSASFAVATTTVSTAKNPNISWTDGTTTHRAVLNITPSPVLLAYAIAPEVVVAGTGATGTVRLNGVAPAGGLVVALASAYPSAIGVPPTVTVPAGADSASFAVETYPAYDLDVWLNTTVSAGGVTKSFRLYLLRSSAANLASLSLSPTILLPGDPAVGTLTLTHAAPAGGTTVLLASSDPGVATVPASVAVPAGATTATFPITTSAAPTGATATIGASLNGVTRSATLRLTYLSSIAVGAGWVVGGQSLSGSIALTGPAPAAGLVVSLTSSNVAVAAVPATVSIAAGADTGSFTITTTTVPSQIPVTITATCLGFVRTAVLNVEQVGFDAFTFSAPANVKAGDVNWVYVVLKAPAPAGGTVVSLTSTGMAQYEIWANHGSYYGPELVTSTTLTIGAGVTSGNQLWVVPWSSSAGSATLTATLNGISKTIPVQVARGTAGFSISQPPTVSRGGTVVASIDFDGEASSPGSMPVTLTSSNPGIVLTSTSVVASAWNPMPSEPLVTRWFMTIGVNAASGTGATTISATFAGVSGSASLTVNPSILTALTLSPATFKGGTPVQITANLDSPAPPGGAVVSLSSSSPTLFPMPSTLLVPAGQRSASVNVTPQNVGTSTALTLFATYGPNTRTLTTKIWADNAALVTGVVLDARVYDHDQPLPGVAVALTTDPANATTTNAAGAFNLLMDPGASSVSLASSGFASTTRPGFTAPPYGTVNEGSIRLKYLLGGPTTVTGRVITAAGAGVSGATGSVEGYQGSFATDATGHFSFVGPSLDPYRLTFSAPGLPTLTSDTFVSFAVMDVSSQLYDFVLDTIPRPSLAAISVSPNPVVGGANATLRLTLTGPAPSTPAPGGMTVSLSFSNPEATPLFGSATIPAGSVYAEFGLPTNLVAVPQTTTITAFAEGVQLATTLTVVPTTGALSSVSVSPTSVVGGAPSTGTVTLSGVAPVGGAVVTLSSNDAAVTVPATVMVAQGATSATLTATTSPVGANRTATLTAVYGYARTATLTLTASAPASVTGVAPGWAVPGDTTPVLYGSNILPGSTVTFTGPVYTLADTGTMLCTPGANCSASALAATVDVAGAYAAFAIPPGAAPGIYQIKTRSPLGVDSSAYQWIAVENAQRTLPALTAPEHNFATRIYPGQTVTGTFNGDTPLSGVSDYNFYYFVATAGSHVNVSLQRVDTSIPWESAASLDPGLEIIAPDGFIYSNLQGFDDSPGSNLNASITDAVLPQTGIYLIAAETTRGSGQYRLSFSLPSVAPAAVGSRVIALSGGGATVPLNRTVTATSVMLDPRGYPVAGADVNFAVESNPDDTGTLTFVGAATPTSLQGTATRTAQITGAGKVRFRPTFTNPVFSSLTAVIPADAAVAVGPSGDELVIPLYRPAARRPFSILGVGTEGGIVLSDRPLTRLEPERIVPRRREEGEPSTISARSALTKPATKTDTGSPTPKVEARPLPRPMSFARVPLAITGCAADLSVFVAAGVNVPEVYPPYTVTLTDLTPPIGGGAADRPIDGRGIRDHRVEKKVRIKIDIKDGHGATPNYPVLVELALGGPRHGTLILNPGGAEVSCDEASFLWHESGNSNEQFDYKLGTLSLFAGLTQDASGAIQPVWEAAEGLTMRISTIDAGGLQTQWENDWAALPQPGKPDHFACYELDGSACPNMFRFWSPYRVFDSGGHQESPPVTIYSAYELADRFDNETYGFSNTSMSMTPPPTNVTAQFFDQVPGTPFTIYGIEWGRYGFSTRWTNVPAWPTGNQQATFRVDYSADPDGDWAGGSVTKDITYQFDTGTSHALIQSTTYDLVKPDHSKGVTDGTFPMSVRPAMLAANMPKTEAGDTRRLTLLTVSGDKTWADWWETIATVTYTNYAEPYSAGTRFWRTSDGGSTFFSGATKTDPKLETADNPAFRFTLIDADWKTVADGSSFRVHRCPRFDHENQGRSCSTIPVDSVNGVVDYFSVNTGDARGYVGVELTRAPLATGLYFIKVESLGQNYRIRRQGQLVVSNDPNSGEWSGAFQIAIVDDPVADCACETCPEQCTASPNFIGTGTYQARATDLTLPTAGFPLQVSRRYLSSNKKSGVAGLGWTTSLESRVWFSTYIAASGLASPAANVLLPGGEQFRFTINGLSGVFDPPAGRRDTLVRNPADLSFDFTVQRSRTVYHFDKNGRLTTMTDEFGNAVTIIYNASGQAQHVTDLAGSGRSIDVSWRGDGKIDWIQDSAGRRVTYGYAADGTLTTVTDPANRVTHYGYTNGSYGPLLTQISDNWNRVLTVVTYDAGDRTKSYSENLETYTYTYVDGATTTKTNSSGQTSTFTTAPNGQITNRTPPPGNGSGTAHTDYYPDGSVAGTTDEMGVRTTYTYDGNGRVATVTRDATGTSPVRFDYTYDPSFPDKVVSVTPKNPGTNAFDPNWQGWKYDYFAGSGTLYHVKRLQNDGASLDTLSTFQYDTKGRVLSQTSATGAVTDYVYSGADLFTVTHPTNNDSGSRPVTTYGNYDGVGRPRTITDPAGKDTTYTYDALGRVLTVTLPKPTPAFAGNFTTMYSYDNFDSPSGLVYTQITDPNGRITNLHYDEHGRLLKSVDAAINTTTYAYTRDVLTSITDANDNVTTYDYDPLKRLDKTTFPDGKFETYTYYADGLLKTKTDRMGQTLTYEYDAFKRLKKKIYPNPAQTITYTYVGQKLTQVDDLYASPAETHTFQYDSSYRVWQNGQSTRGTLTYTYTPDDRVDTMTIAGTPNVTTAHTYYADGSLKTIVWSPQTGQFKYDYTPRGQYQTVTFPNGQTRSYSYDDQGRLTNLANALGATNIATYAYGYDVDWASGLNTMLGQRVSMTATVPSQGFTNALTKYSYDPLYQLKKAEYPNVAPFNNEVHQWTYDAIGNRLTNQVNAAIQTYTYEKIGANPKNAQKLLNDGTNAYAYDFNGSQTSRTGFGFGNDVENRLASITGGATAAYTYDYQGRRTSKTVAGVTTKYVYDGLNLVSETTAGASTRYAFGPSIDEPLAVYASGAVSYVAVDGLGSAVGEANATGTVLHSSIFDVWGVARTETGTRFIAFGYASREFGDAGLWFYRARQYEPWVGRFSSEDKLGFLAGQASFYAYVGSSPVIWYDPWGLSGTLTVSARNPKDESSFGRDYGHVWIEYTPDGGSRQTYGTYANNPGGQTNGLIINWEETHHDAYGHGDASRTTWIDDDQERALMDIINRYRKMGTDAWSYGRPCTRFAWDAWHAATGEKLAYVALPVDFVEGITRMNGGLTHRRIRFAPRK